MSESNRLDDVPRRSITRRNIRVLLGLTLFNSLLLVGIGTTVMSDPASCRNTILLDGDGTSYSDYYKNRDVAEEEVFTRVKTEADLLSAKKVSMYRCPNACPEKFSTMTTVDIRNVRVQFGPPPGEETSKWSASSSFLWYANLSCS